MAGEPEWMALARSYLGTKEKPGRQHNAAIVAFFKDAGHSGVKDDETYWCAAFAGAALERCGIRSTRSLLARSYLKWGRPLLKPQPGCIAVFKRGKSSWGGHVAFFVGETADKIKVLGGNQRNSVSIASCQKSDLLGYRWPDIVAAKKPPGRPVGGLGLLSAGEVAEKEATPPGAPQEAGETALSPHELKAVQKRLADLGYKEVGQPDGEWGSRTTAALSALQHDRKLPVSGALDEATRAAMKMNIARPIPVERREATAAEVAKKAPEVAPVQQNKVWTVFGMLSAAVIGAAEGIMSFFGSAAEKLTPVREFLTDVPGWAWAAGAGGIAFLLWHNSRKAEQKSVEAYRAGERL